MSARPVGMEKQSLVLATPMRSTHAVSLATYTRCLSLENAKKSHRKHHCARAHGAATARYPHQLMAASAGRATMMIFLLICDGTG